MPEGTVEPYPQNQNITKPRLRSYLREEISKRFADSIKILYGGKKENFLSDTLQLANIKIPSV